MEGTLDFTDQVIVPPRVEAACNAIWNAIQPLLESITVVPQSLLGRGAALEVLTEQHGNLTFLGQVYNPQDTVEPFNVRRLRNWVYHLVSRLPRTQRGLFMSLLPSSHPSLFSPDASDLYPMELVEFDVLYDCRPTIREPSPLPMDPAESTSAPQSLGSVDSNANEEHGSEDIPRSSKRPRIGPPSPSLKLDSMTLITPNVRSTRAARNAALAAAVPVFDDPTDADFIPPLPQPASKAKSQSKSKSKSDSRSSSKQKKSVGVSAKTRTSASPPVRTIQEASVVRHLNRQAALNTNPGTPITETRPVNVEQLSFDDVKRLAADHRQVSGLPGLRPQELHIPRASSAMRAMLQVQAHALRLPAEAAR
ncbi:hypothetical protein GALMADRAFT_149088 [Galerina marginata CBS 339.88]|uniref:Uncharacterized protein n=1 Tax=Galerina marginata (strain CBS 339.88) TaxID=685588 RepID=A0A067S550_GALM3|nr:hypothetical protein GALMADRAFT_149088 [Galerina marginata CBS 339.88]